MHRGEKYAQRGGSHGSSRNRKAVVRLTSARDRESGRRERTRTYLFFTYSFSIHFAGIRRTLDTLLADTRIRGRAELVTRGRIELISYTGCPEVPLVSQ